MSEDTVIRHGAPTLAGMKTGNLFPCFFSSPQALAEELRAMNRVLVPRGLRLVPLRREKGRALLYLFRPAALSGTWPRRRSAACSARRATGTWARGPAWRNSAAAWGPAGSLRKFCRNQAFLADFRDFLKSL